MAGPIIGTQGFDNPPEEMRLIIGDNAYQYFVMLHTIIFKLGGLDATNITGDLTDTVDHAQFIGVEPYQHHGSDNHAALTQATSISAVATLTVTVDSADATAAYTIAEQALINELKTDLIATISNVNGIASKLNSLITVLKSADLMK